MPAVQQQWCNLRCSVNMESLNVLSFLIAAFLEGKAVTPPHTRYTIGRAQPLANLQHWRTGSHLHTVCLVPNNSILLK